MQNKVKIKKADGPQTSAPSHSTQTLENQSPIELNAWTKYQIQKPQMGKSIISRKVEGKITHF